jgi:Zn-finger nucleic acid-binding protein
MANCSHCGAPIVLSATAATSCGFCGVYNGAERARVAEVVPVHVVQRVVHVAPGAGDAEDHGRCPHCQRAFVSVTVEGVVLHGCGACGGIWLDNAGSRAVLENPVGIFENLSSRAAQNARSTRPRNPRPPCPQCACVLERRWFHEAVQIDVCPDHGTWFDALELGALVKAVRAAKRVLERDASGGSVACAKCSAVVLRTKTQITASGTICDACYRTEQEKAASAMATGTPTASVLLDLHAALYQK